MSGGARRQELGASQVGFQASETSRAEVVVYTVGSERGLNQQRAGEIRFGGFSNRDEEPSLVAVQTQKHMGQAAGTFSFDVKSPSTPSIDFRNVIAEDDWVDISFSRHEKKFHVMRGLVDDVRQVQTISDGATDTVYRISGRDFGKIFAITPIWFDRITDGEYIGGAANRIGFFLTDDPADTARKMLLGFLQELQNKGRANWEIPLLPGESAGTFVDTVRFIDTDFKNIPDRSSAINPNFFSPFHNYIWPLAMEWSDAPLCELYVDLVRSSSIRNYQFQEDEEVAVGDAVMGIIFRDRPFATFEKDEPIKDGPWFTKVPVFNVPRQSIVENNTGRGGTERYNAYFVSPKLFNGELGAAFLDLQVPLVNDEDIRRHGFRRMDITTRFVAKQAVEPIGLTSRRYRRMVRDYHCLNHLFYNGRISLAHGRPDIRIGTRMRIPAVALEDVENYYVEGVLHDWNLPDGVTTSLDVTRGWIGDDDDMLSVLTEIVDQYDTLLPVGDAAEETA